MPMDGLQAVARLGGPGVGGVWTRYLTVFDLSVITSNIMFSELKLDMTVSNQKKIS